jgi:tetratricopeptide (TPR) repeat protein
LARLFTEKEAKPMKWLSSFAALALASRVSGQDTDCDSMEKCRAALEANKRSSLIHFRIAEFCFTDKNYICSANEFRAALAGDLNPKWTEVWAHVNLGKIFDVTGQRERALNEYRLAKRTGDNTRGAQDEAAKYSKEPYKGD